MCAFRQVGSRCPAQRTSARRVAYPARGRGSANTASGSWVPVGCGWLWAVGCGQGTTRQPRLALALALACNSFSFTLAASTQAPVPALRVTSKESIQITRRCERQPTSPAPPLSDPPHKASYANTTGTHELGVGRGRGRWRHFIHKQQQQQQQQRRRQQQQQIASGPSAVGSRGSNTRTAHPKTTPA